MKALIGRGYLEDRKGSNLRLTLGEAVSALDKEGEWGLFLAFDEKPFSCDLQI